MRPLIITGLMVLVLLGSCGYTPKSPDEANNTIAPIETVKNYLHALETGRWDDANANLSDNFRFRSSGDSWLGRGRKKHILPLYQAWRKAFPNFRFNEELLDRTANGVRLGIYYSGTHRDTLDLPWSGFPMIDSSGTSIRMPIEYHTFYVESDKIVYQYVEVPTGSGESALLERLQPPPPDTSAVGEE